MKQANRVKAAMRAGRKAHGYNLSFPSPWVIDILGKLDFDFVFIDGEHGPFGLDQLEDLCRTAERHNLTPIARVPDIGSSTILRYLVRGIMGILGPHIATEADARQLARACYFGPLGERSFGANRGIDYNAGIADKAAYYREANEQMLVCALLEDVAVLENLDAILSVPGIDLYSIGPNDFAQSLRYPASPTIRKSSRQCRKSQIASDRSGAGCNRTRCTGRGSAICCSMRVGVFYHRSMGERGRPEIGKNLS
jgi:2-keto-3-deoxy-L-rhamnonate aldolase RhmA